LSDLVVRRDESVGGMWGWIAGVAVPLLIGFLIIAGWNSNSNTASSGPSTSTTTSIARAHRDPAKHRGLRLVSAAADQPGAVEERHAVARQLFHEIPVPAPQGRRDNG
jgi:hypothetical protein